MTVPKSLLATTMVESEWQDALRWRERFLRNDFDSDIPPLPNQLVAFLVSDSETLRKVDEAAKPLPPSSLSEERREEIAQGIADRIDTYIWDEEGDEREYDGLPWNIQGIKRIVSQTLAEALKDGGR